MQATRTEDSCSAVTDPENVACRRQRRRKRRTSIASGDHGGVKVGGLSGCRLSQSSVFLFFFSSISDFR